MEARSEPLGYVYLKYFKGLRSPRRSVEQSSRSEQAAAIEAGMRGVLGIDGGGTKTVCLLADEAGVVVGRGEAGASNYQSAGGAAAYRAILTAISQAIADFDDTVTVRGLTLGLAGVGRPDDVAAVRDWVELLQADDRLPLRWQLPPTGARVCPDCEIALVGGLGGAVGVAAIAGTGAIAYGRNGRGQVARASGWGSVLGDEGSGYDLARQGLRAVVRARDGRSPQTALTAAFCDRLALGDVRELVERVYRQGWTVKDMAALAPVVDAVAAAGDAVATAIVEDAAAELAIATLAVGRQLFAPEQPYDVVTVGGLWQGSSDLSGRFQRQLRQRRQGVTVSAARYDAAYGAVLLALRSPEGR